MKIFLPVSCNGSGDGKTGWAISLATSFNGRSVQIENMGGSHADRACNNMANRFLQTDCDVMFIIDIDTEFRKQDVDRVISHIEAGHKAVWGLYPKKQDECLPCVNTWPEVPPPDERGLVNVRRSGRGFLMVTRDVFERLKEDNGGPALRFHNHGQLEWAFFRSGAVTGDYSAVTGELDPDGYPLREWISEDWLFCEDLRNVLGIPTLVDTGVVLAHIGAKTYRFPPSQLVRVDSGIESWRDIHGWFDYEDLYRRIVSDIPDGGTFVEVGSWLGRSLGGFADFAREAGKNIALHAVDTFNGEPANPAHADILAAHGGSVGGAFRSNMTALGVNAATHSMPSCLAANQFGRSSSNAVFIDADHSKEAVARDIAAWLPVVKPGGILAGHDIDEPGVFAAVQESGLPYEVMGRCWVHQKSEHV